MAALLTFESGDTDKVVEYMAEAAQMGISIGAPNINACGADFTVDGQTIRFGLAAVKGVGQRAVEAIIQARQQAGRFRDLFHFCESVDLKQVNRTAIDALVKCGAFDGLGAHRGAMLAAVDHAMDLGNTAADDRRSGQMSFFGSAGGSDGQPAPANFPSVEPLAESQLLQFEKETLGFYVTSHPLVKYGRQLDHLGSVRCASLKDAAEGAPAVLGCMIAAIRQRITKSGRSAGQKMAILTVEDLTGSCECVVFSETYEKLQHLLREEAILFLVGKVDRRRETPQIIVEDAVPIEKAVETLTGGVLLRLAKSPDRENLQALGGLLGRHRGRCPLLLEVQPASRDDLRVVVKPSAGWLVAPSRDLYDQLCGLLGQQNVVLMPKKTNGNGNGRRTWPSRPSQRTAFAEPGQGPG
jgi:DNA polymerase-3 subunit alpha